MRWRRFFELAAIVAVGMATASVAQERFDYRVRDDMFRAFGGNEAAFKSAMSTIDEKLREDPDHAEALVWRGVGGFLQASRASSADAKTSATNALIDMDRALALQPRNIGVLVPRASVLLVA